MVVDGTDKCPRPIDRSGYVAAPQCYGREQNVVPEAVAPQSRKLSRRQRGRFKENLNRP